MIDTSYTYKLKSDFLNNFIAIEFEITKDKTEFLKHLFQILGMYNFVIKSHQNTWQKNEPQVIISAPTGVVLLKVDRYQKISLLADGNTKELLNISTILNKLSIFKEQEPLLNLLKEKRALQMQDSL